MLILYTVYIIYIILIEFKIITKELRKLTEGAQSTLFILKKIAITQNILSTVNFIFVKLSYF